MYKKQCIQNDAYKTCKQIMCTKQCIQNNVYKICIQWIQNINKTMYTKQCIQNMYKKQCKPMSTKHV